MDASVAREPQGKNEYGLYLRVSSIAAITKHPKGGVCIHLAAVEDPIVVKHTPVEVMETIMRASEVVELLGEEEGNNGES